MPTGMFSSHSRKASSGSLSLARYVSTHYLATYSSKSLKGMQMFRFIFLARSWAADQAQLDKKLSKLGKKAEQEDDSFAFILFPEGTLVSRDTRPISRRYAEKLGVVRICVLCIVMTKHYLIKSPTSITSSFPAQLAFTTVFDHWLPVYPC